MRPPKSLPYGDDFSSAEDYVEKLLDFCATSELLQFFCGGVHILDFFTSEPGLFVTGVPREWQSFLLETDPMHFLDFLMRTDLDSLPPPGSAGAPPPSLLQYVKDIRKFSLDRSFQPSKPKLPVLPRSVALGMKVKKIHEVTHFSGYIDKLCEDVAEATGDTPTHLVDFGSGQNYLGRTLASPPYNKHIVAVESKEANMAGAKALDILSGFAEMEKVPRNKRIYNTIIQTVPEDRRHDEEALKQAARNLGMTDDEIATIDLRSRREMQAIYTAEEGKGYIEYVVGRLEHADLSGVISQLRASEDADRPKDLRMMAVSIHSCGNLSHYGIRSLITNPCMKAVAIVGCCYNLLTEKLTPPTHKLPFQRPSLRPINARVARESSRGDSQGFPLSDRVSTYNGHGIPLNITARMMACQAPQNWTEKESDSFFTRHFYRAVLQRIFLDKGVISRVYHGEDDSSPFNSSTNPVIIGSLRKQCYSSLGAYVRGAIAKLTTNADFSQYSDVIREKLGDISDDEIARYEDEYRCRKRELSAVWSLMSFSACVIESLIVTDRWLFLREHSDIVRDCWVETVFDYRESPRNLVVDGSFSLIHIPLALYSNVLQPILQVLLPQSSPSESAPDSHHGFLNISVTPLECSVVCHTVWAKTVFEPAIARLPAPTKSTKTVTISKDSYAVFSVISAGMDAASRVVDLTSPLALAGIPIFFITTYYSDFILVPTKDRQSVVTALLARGFEFSEENGGASFRPAGTGTSSSGPGSAAHSRGPSQSSEPPSTPPPSSVGELQTRTFDMLKKRSVAPFVEENLALVHCSGRDAGSFSDRPSLARSQTGGSGNGRGRGKSWVDTVDTKLYAGVVSALASQPRFLSLTLAQDDPPSLLLDRELLHVFGDALVGPTEGNLVPIFLDLDKLPLEATGIVAGVAGRLVQEMRMVESSELSYLSTARAGAVILSGEQSVKALEVLKESLEGGGR
ncbi:methyltransferase domain-containing protein [Echria macrotheca]|uniref:Methyltransferase domain-containing protein n=1 Tax=Echria macrotheca TaxID=438768 RepID=A0AAJ0FH29_9PEZI|nr:methyltransferase domain-containing protein [Echria macrotheca]